MGSVPDLPGAPMTRADELTAASIVAIYLEMLTGSTTKEQVRKLRIMRRNVRGTSNG